MIRLLAMIAVMGVVSTANASFSISTDLNGGRLSSCEMVAVEVYAYKNGWHVGPNEAHYVIKDVKSVQEDEQHNRATITFEQVWDGDGPSNYISTDSIVIKRGYDASNADRETCSVVDNFRTLKP